MIEFKVDDQVECEAWSWSGKITRIWDNRYHVTNDLGSMWFHAHELEITEAS